MRGRNAKRPGCTKRMETRGAHPVRLPATVIVLGCVSLLNDVASDMIAPLLPLFLTVQLGAAPTVVGLIEGIAETTSSLLKLVGGRLADRGLGCKPLTVAGYTISNLARPCVGLAGHWAVVLGLRFGDRLGKGLRTAPRDAWIAGAAPAAIRGRAFGFHRSMDHAGAMLGPLAAAALLKLGADLQQVFLASAVPGALAIALVVFGGREPSAAGRSGLSGPVEPGGRLPPAFRLLVGATGAVALATVPDAFLVLWLHQGGVATAEIPILWAAAHAVRSFSAWPCGRAADRWGRRTLLLVGWTLRAGLLVLMSSAGSRGALAALYLLHAGATAATEGAERAFLADAVPPAVKGTAFGLYHMVTGVLALPAAVGFGWIWERLGMHRAFLVAALVTGTAAARFALRTRGQGPGKASPGSSGV